MDSRSRGIVERLRPLASSCMVAPPLCRTLPAVIRPLAYRTLGNGRRFLRQTITHNVGQLGGAHETELDALDEIATDSALVIAQSAESKSGHWTALQHRLFGRDGDGAAGQSQRTGRRRCIILRVAVSGAATSRLARPYHRRMRIGFAPATARSSAPRGQDAGETRVWIPGRGGSLNGCGRWQVRAWSPPPYAALCQPSFGRWPTAPWATADAFFGRRSRTMSGSSSERMKPNSTHSTR